MAQTLQVHLPLVVLQQFVSLNTTGTARLVTVIDEVGGSTTIGTFTLLGNTREVVEKKSTEAIFAAHASVLGAKVGYTIS